VDVGYRTIFTTKEGRLIMTKTLRRTVISATLMVALLLQPWWNVTRTKALVNDFLKKVSVGPVLAQVPANASGGYNGSALTGRAQSSCPSSCDHPARRPSRLRLPTTAGP
jgi:hypothetical protein